MKKSIYMNDEKMAHIKYLFKIHKHSEALNEIDEYIIEYPNEYYAYVFKAMILLCDEKIIEAENLLNDVLLHDIDSTVKVFAYEQFATLSRQKGDREEAIMYYEKVLSESNFVCLKTRKELSILYYDLGSFEKAIALLNVPGFNDETLNVARVNVYYKMSRYKEALKSLEEPFYNTLQYNYAKVFDTVDKKSVIHAEALLLKGNIYNRQKKYKEALETYKQGLKVTNNKKLNYDLLNQIGMIYYKLGEYTKGIDICTDIIKSFPTIDNTSTYVLLCNCCIKLGNTKKMLPIIEKCKNSKIKCLCQIELLVSKFEFEKALSLFPFCDITKYNVLFLELVILYRLNRYEDFIKVFKEFSKCEEYNEQRKSVTEVKRMKLYMEYDRGLTNMETVSYADNLYKEYNSEDVINHIIERHAKALEENEFNLDTNFNELYEYVLDKLDNSDVICDGLYDEYYIKVDKPYLNGLSNQLSYIGVICIPNSKKIITMYPIINYESEKEEFIPKVIKKEKTSRIDKFNKKYGL